MSDELLSVALEIPGADGATVRRLDDQTVHLAATDPMRSAVRPNRSAGPMDQSTSICRRLGWLPSISRAPPHERNQRRSANPSRGWRQRRWVSRRSGYPSGTSRPGRTPLAGTPGGSGRRDRRHRRADRPHRLAGAVGAGNLSHRPELHQCLPAGVLRRDHGRGDGLRHRHGRHRPLRWIDLDAEQRDDGDRAARRLFDLDRGRGLHACGDAVRVAERRAQRRARHPDHHRHAGHAQSLSRLGTGRHRTRRRFPATTSIPGFSNGLAAAIPSSGSGSASG